VKYIQHYCQFEVVECQLEVTERRSGQFRLNLTTPLLNGELVMHLNFSYGSILIMEKYWKFPRNPEKIRWKFSGQFFRPTSLSDREEKVKQIPAHGSAQRFSLRRDTAATAV